MLYHVLGISSSFDRYLTTGDSSSLVGSNKVALGRKNVEQILGDPERTVNVYSQLALENQILVTLISRGLFSA